MRVKVAIGLVVAFLATMLSVGPASAGVNVIVRSNGDIVINGDGGDNQVHLVFCGDGSAIVFYGDPYSDPDGYEVIEAVEDDVTINLKGGNDRVAVGHGFFGDQALNTQDYPDECELDPEGVDAANGEHGYDIPGNLKIFGASGNDDAFINGIYVGKDVTVSLSSGSNSLYMNYVHVGDDVTVRASSGNDDVFMYGFWIYDRMDINLSAGNNEFYFGDGSTARAIIRGHNGDDDIETGISDPPPPPPAPPAPLVDFGHNPIMITGGGTDYVSLDYFTWSGKLRLNTGSGGDGVYLAFGGDLEGMAEPEPVLDLDTAAGDDVVHIYGRIIPGDDLNGGPGNNDEITYEMELDEGATIKNFEHIFDHISCC